VSFLGPVVQWLVVVGVVVVIARAVMKSRNAAKGWEPMLGALARRFEGTVVDAAAGKEASVRGRIGAFEWAVTLETTRERHTYTQIACSNARALDTTIGRRRESSAAGVKTGVRSFDATVSVGSVTGWIRRVTPEVRAALGVLLPEGMVANRAMSLRLNGRRSDTEAIASRIEAARVLLAALDREVAPSFFERMEAETDPAFRAALVLAADEERTREADATVRRGRRDDDPFVRFFGTSLEKGTVDADGFRELVGEQLRSPPAREVAALDRLALLCGLAQRLPSAALRPALEAVATRETLQSEAEAARARVDEVCDVQHVPTADRVPDGRTRQRRVRVYAQMGTAHREQVIEGLLAQLLGDPDPLVRRVAATGLLDLDAREVVARVRPALDDPDEGNDRANEWSVSDYVREMLRRWGASRGDVV